ncbi:M1 family metallopeptidase [Mucilaginibacter puniceus]
MLKSIISIVLAYLFIAQGHAQTLTIPEGIAKTYSNGTRNTNGKPGKSYWQNRARYNISVAMSPPGTTINGVEQITYFNNSPDKLDSLNMKLIINVHRAGRRGNPDAGIFVDDFKINGNNATWDNSKAITTNYMVGLPKPLMPHDSVKLNITWHYQLSDGTTGGREGVINPTTFYLAYFYPRVAVYDDYKGWDTQPHTGSLEFYNDFNDYTLNVTVPKNYIVWATGDLRNPNQVLQPEFAKRLTQSFTSDSTVHVATAQDMANKNVTTQNEMNTWTFTSSNITDVALGVSNTYVWDAASVVVDDKTKRRASVQAAFPDASEDFHHSVQFSRYALGWFSRNIPGVPYPFSKSTAFQGTADMEYPMMVNDSPQEDLAFAQLVQDHEQAHTYFPFYMGINESYYAFMDEGWATTLEYLIGIDSKGKKAADDFYKKFRINGWAKGRHTNEIPVITPSPEVRSGAGNNAYNKPSLSYLALKDYLGDALFKKGLHTFMANWNGKHPIPWDYFNSMSTGSGKNLNWFFYNWFYTNGYIDLALENVEQKGAGYTLTVKNIGGFAAPFDVILTYSDGTTGTIHQTPAVWEANQKQATINLKNNKTVTAVELDGGIFMDADVSNNKWSK